MGGDRAWVHTDAALSDRGQVERALREMEEGIRLSEQVGFLSPPITIRCDLARLYCSLGAVEKGLELNRLVLEVAESRLPALRVYALVGLVHLSLARGDIAEAESLVEKARPDPHRNGLGTYQSLIPLAEAELALAQRQFERASELAGTALTAARETGTRAFGRPRSTSRHGPGSAARGPISPGKPGGKPPAKRKPSALGTGCGRFSRRSVNSRTTKPGPKSYGSRRERWYVSLPSRHRQSFAIPFAANRPCKRCSKAVDT